MGDVRPIPRNLLQRLMGGYGNALRTTGNALKGVNASNALKYGPALDYAADFVGEGLVDSGQSVEDWSYGFSPIHGTGNLTQPVVNAEQLAGVLGAVPPVGQVARAVPGAVKHAARDFAEAAVAGNPRMTAYHGTPHDFDEFDLTKIGTGEGAQAYGHGLYFAENPKVAQQYQTALAGHGDVFLNGKALSANDPVENNVSTLVKHHNGDIAKATEQARGFAKETDPKQAEIFKRVADALESGQVSYKAKGNLMHVDIPDEHVAKMLDWDAPIKSQPHIQQHLEALGFSKLPWPYTGLRAPNGQIITTATGGGDIMDVTGEQVYRALAYPKKDAEVSAKLRELGIPGLKYLDGQSRSDGKGTRNLVLFDDKIPKILKKE